MYWWQKISLLKVVRTDVNSACAVKTTMGDLLEKSDVPLKSMGEMSQTVDFIF